MEEPQTLESLIQIYKLNRSCSWGEINTHYQNHSTVTNFVSELVKPTPHLLFDYVITSHQFNPTPYFTKQLSEDRINTQNKIRELNNQGLGYTKIHQYLVKNGYEIGKSKTTVDSIIKRMKKRDEFFTKPILDGIGNFRVKMLEVH